MIGSRRYLPSQITRPLSASTTNEIATVQWMMRSAFENRRISRPVGSSRTPIDPRQL